VRFNSAWDRSFLGFACLGDKFCGAALLYRPERRFFSWSLETLLVVYYLRSAKSAFSGDLRGSRGFSFFLLLAVLWLG